MDSNNPMVDTKPIPQLNAATLLSWRERMGYSQREACEVLGCSRGAWSATRTG